MFPGANVSLFQLEITMRPTHLLPLEKLRPGLSVSQLRPAILPHSLEFTAWHHPWFPLNFDFWNWLGRLHWRTHVFYFLHRNFPCLPVNNYLIFKFYSIHLRLMFLSESVYLAKFPFADMYSDWNSFLSFYKTLKNKNNTKSKACCFSWTAVYV